METVVIIRIDEGSEMGRVLSFLTSYPDLSFPCRKVRQELVKRDGIKRTSASVEFTLRRLVEKEIIEKTGEPGRYEYKIKTKRKKS